MSNGLPLVTFALFTYNQQEYVHAALNSALLQDYANLQVIVSDDCSEDRTFDVAAALVDAYDGPHEVLIRRTQTNRGSLLHVAEVARIARGDFIVLAAGDDISKPSRTTVLVNAWRESGAWGFCSRFDRIDSAGRVLELNSQSAVTNGTTFRKYFYDEEGEIGVIHGCTSAYDTRLFDYLPCCETDYVLSEDGALSVLLNLLGKRIVELPDSLVLYRESENSLTNSGAKRRLSFERVLEDERRIERFALGQANRCRLFLRMPERLGADAVRRLRIETVEDELARQTVRATFRRMTWAGRWKSALRSPREFWILPRLFGMNAFFRLKWLVRRLTGDGV